MYRFIKCEGLYPNAEKQFAFYNTVNDRFITVHDDQLFETVEELKSAMDDAKYTDKAKYRLLSLIPYNYGLDDDNE